MSGPGMLASTKTPRGSATPRGAATPGGFFSGGGRRSSNRRRGTTWMLPAPVADWTGASRGMLPNFRKMDLHIRDLRLLSPVSNGSVRPVIELRKQCIVLKLEHVRAAILHDTLFLMGDFEGPLALTETRLDYFKERLCTKCTQRPDQSFELYVVEMLLNSVHDSLEVDLVKLKQESESLHKAHTMSKKKQMSPVLMDTLRKLLVSFAELFARGEDVCQSLAVVLDTPGDLAMMRLTSLTTAEQMDLLLEMSWQAISNVNHEVMQLIHELSEEQDEFQLKLDYFSNRFVWSSFTFRIVNLVFTFGAMWTAVLGMNVSVGEDGWDPTDPYGTFQWRRGSCFIVTTASLCLGCFLMCCVTLWCVSRAYVG